MAEEHMDEREPFTGREKDQKRTKRQRKTDEINKTQHSDIRRLSQPAQQTVRLSNHCLIIKHTSLSE